MTASILPEPVLDANALTIDDAIASYQRHLRAGNKSPHTIKTYLAAIDQFNAFIKRQGMPQALPAIRREHLESFIVTLQEAGKRPATVSLAFRSLQPFFKWAVGEDEIDESPMARMARPIVPEEPPQVLSAAQYRTLLKACEGNTFEARRDTAICSLLYDTGIRRGELIGLRIDDVDFDNDVVHVFGKGRRPRAVPFGHKTAKALDRYVRKRREHREARQPELWLGVKGPLTDNGVLLMIRRRGRQAGIAKLHPHLFRHTFAHTLLADGMQEGDLMRLAGWRSRQMLSRYGASAADERARAAYRQHSPADHV